MDHNVDQEAQDVSNDENGEDRSKSNDNDGSRFVEKHRSNHRSSDEVLQTLPFQKRYWKRNDVLLLQAERTCVGSSIEAQ